MDLQPEYFDYLIIAVIVVGSVWAVIRLYRDLAGGPREDIAYLYDTPKLKNEDLP